MKLTPERLRQNAAAMLSLADGKPIQYRMRSDYAGDMDWKDYDPDSRAPDYGTWEYRPKPEPKVRPWTIEEIGERVGSIVISKNPTNPSPSVILQTNGIMVWIGACPTPVTPRHLFESYTMKDGSPCGTEEA